MFKFDFDLADDEVDESLAQQLSSAAEQQSVSQDPIASTSAEDPTRGQHVEHSLQDLIDTLPDMISFSPLHIPDPSDASAGTYLCKRDLYDARYQLIASGADEHASAAASTSLDSDLQYVEAPSDLVPGVYEGGLKTWECSIDLAGCLKSALPAHLAGRTSLRSLELGCGTAVPTILLLHELFSSEPQPERKIEVHLQDYNELVFRLVTLPNIILAWYMSPASSSFLSSPPPSDPDSDPLPPADPTSPGDLPLTPALINAFKSSLAQHNISLRFFSGSWSNFPTTGRYDVLLTSETIYARAQLPALCDLLWRAHAGGDVADAAARLTLDSQEETSKADPNQKKEDEGRERLCLVAAKRVYFGVGGGVAEFTRAVEDGVPSTCGRPRGEVRTVYATEGGVKRVVIDVRW